MDERTTAFTNRSLRTIRSELEFLADSSLLNPTQLSQILDLLPSPTPTSTTGTSTISSLTAAFNAHSLQPNSTSASTGRTQPALPSRNTPLPTPTPTQTSTSTYQPFAPTPAPTYTPPAHVLATATALYAYTPTDTADLALNPNDPISITEYMNADWAKGRNDSSGHEGIFPRSYVRIISENEKAGTMAMVPPPPPRTSGSGYGNVPLEVAHGETGPGKTGNAKFDENSKKFGKKLGNAAIFGAGATIGGKIVNGIF